MKTIVKFLIFTVILSVIFSSTQAQTAEDTVKTYELDQVVITGTRIQKEKGKVPSSITVVDQTEIEETGKLNVLPVLSTKVPGLFVNERSIIGYGVGPASGGGISIRGLSSSGDPANTRVLVLIDGQPQFMGVFGHPIHDSYFSSNVERVEVLRGPASILYGSNAMGGAINIITRKPKEEGFNNSGMLSYGSFNTQKYNLNLGYKKDQWNIYGAFNHARTDGHRDEDSNEFNTTGGFLGVGYRINDKYKISVDGNIADSRFYDPGPIDNPDNFVNRNYDFTRGRAAISIDNSYGKVEGALKLFYNFGEHEFFDGFSSNDFNRGLTFYQNLKLFDGNIFTVGVDYKNFGGEAENENIPVNSAIDVSIDEIDGYGLIQQTFFDKLNLNAGVRLVSNSEFGSETIPQFGFTYNVNPGTTFKGSAAKGFRSPTAANLFFAPPANSDLQPESMWNYELSYLQSILEDRFYFEVTGYISQGDNLIQTVMLEPGRFGNVNTGEFNHRGIEFLASFQATKSLNLSTNYSFLHMETPLPYAPKHQLNFQANYTVNRFKILANLKQVSDLRVGVRGTGPVDASLPLQNYTLFDLRISAQATDWLNVFLDGENLLDEEYQLDKGYPLPGATFLGGLHFKL